MTFWHFFELQKAVLGDLSFDRENGLQIQKLLLGWKVDSQKFPTSLLCLNLDTCKCPNYHSKGAQPVRHWCATRQADFAKMHCTGQKTQI